MKIHPDMEFPAIFCYAQLSASTMMLRELHEAKNF